MTDGRTQLVGLLGWPVEHSLSPAIAQRRIRSARSELAVRGASSAPRM